MEISEFNNLSSISHEEIKKLKEAIYRDELSLKGMHFNLEEYIKLKKEDK